MPSASWTQIGRHRIKLTNLEKFLFPDAGIVKAEVIQYYLSIAPHILRHIKHRPLTFIRYPDGITEESFYQKNKPQFAPDWLQTVALGKSRRINYLMATNEASLVWFANQACIEFHQQSIRYPNLEMPDHFVIDLDPPDGLNFNIIKDLAFSIKNILEHYDYTPFVKTSGRKGLHVVVPVRQAYTYDQIKTTLNKLSKRIVNENKNIATLQMRKDARDGKILLDIVRNSTSQTTACPYTLRATPEATVSMPVTWDALGDLTGPDTFTIKNVPSILSEYGDPWEGLYARSNALHDLRRQHALTSLPVDLQDYTSKRDFDTTPEPMHNDVYVAPDSFVLQRHDSSRLHYDLRLAENGILRSWALPKGLPPEPGVKYLAIETEPHPLSYLKFEGQIPHGQYGAGTMSIVTTGSYTITKTKKNGFYFRLSSAILETEYRIHLMKEKEWLIERVDGTDTTTEQSTIAPMLCTSAPFAPGNIDFEYEVKWDGIRAQIYISKESIRIASRSGREITNSFPELTEDSQYLRLTEGILDGEIVVLDEAGRPNFKSVISRMNASKSIIKKPNLFFYAFDLLYVDGIKTMRLPLKRRRLLLKQTIKPGLHIRLSETVEDGEGLLNATREANLEGIVGKDQTSIYQPGVRSPKWLKIKHRNTMTCLILGYTIGKGEREGTFGALHIADTGTPPSYMGKVGTGFTDAELHKLRVQIDQEETSDTPVQVMVETKEHSVWLCNPMYCEVEYAAITSRGTLREPVYLNLRPDM